MPEKKLFSKDNSYEDNIRQSVYVLKDIYKNTAALIRNTSWRNTATSEQDEPWLYPYEKLDKEDYPFITHLFAHTEGSIQAAETLFIDRFNDDVCFECGGHKGNIKINMIDFHLFK